MPTIEPPSVPDVRETPTELEPVSELDFLDIGAPPSPAAGIGGDDPFALPAPDFGDSAFDGPSALASDELAVLESNDLPLLDEDVPLSPAEAHKDVLDLPPAPARNTPLANPQIPQPIRPSRPTPSFVNLAEWLAEETPSTPRMTIGEPTQSGDEQADFQNILSEFRAGIDAVIPEDDAASHYDLGIAFREMGLLDDAIAEFQTALRGTDRRAETLEALGGCFLAKEQPEVARTLLLRALEEPAAPRGDDGLRGVLYLLGRACEDLGTPGEAIRYYQRVYAVDIRFKDVAARIQALQKSPR
jgi:tetratricopeptide (TPR) repeat protein